jgi:FAD:protein FMN transferase
MRSASKSRPPGCARFEAIGTTVTLLTVEPGALPLATALLERQLVELDQACSRFQESSELRRAEEAGGRPVAVSPLLAELVGASLQVAELTEGTVDPTVGGAIAALGYDRDYELVASQGPGPLGRPLPAPGWKCIDLDTDNRVLTLPDGVHLDLGSSAKAFAADRAAHDIVAEFGTGALVNLGGDIATAGLAPQGGWRVALALSSSVSPCDAQVTISLSSPGLASSGSTVRVWEQGGKKLHHIVDPRTGDAANNYWALATVAAGSCLVANAASTAVIVMGEDAPGLLAKLGLPARLVGRDGRVVVLNGWPEDHR